MAKKIRKTFRVQGLVTSVVEVEVYAETLSEAVEASKSLNTSDFVSFEGEVADCSMKVIGVFSDWPDFP